MHIWIRQTLKDAQLIEMQRQSWFLVWKQARVDEGKKETEISVQAVAVEEDVY